MYIDINESMISWNSKKKFVINMTNNFYNNIRMPLVLRAKCITNDAKFLNVNGFIIQII